MLFHRGVWCLMFTHSYMVDTTVLDWQYSRGHTLLRPPSLPGTPYGLLSLGVYQVSTRRLLSSTFTLPERDSYHPLMYPTTLFLTSRTSQVGDPRHTTFYSSGTIFVPFPYLGRSFVRWNRNLCYVFLRFPCDTSFSSI